MAKLCMQNYVYYDLYLCTARKDFRPCYGKLGMLASLFPSLPFLALTATATQQTATATLSYKFTWFFIYFLFLSADQCKGPMLETLDYTIPYWQYTDLIISKSHLNGQNLVFSLAMQPQVLCLAFPWTNCQLKTLAVISIALCQGKVFNIL